MPDGGTRYCLERLAPQLQDSDPVEEAFFVDCGLSLHREEAVNDVDGLDHLEGQSLAVLADGSRGRLRGAAGPHPAALCRPHRPGRPAYASVLSPLPWKATANPAARWDGNGRWAAAACACTAAWAGATEPAATNFTTSPSCPGAGMRPANLSAAMWIFARRRTRPLGHHLAGAGTSPALPPAGPEPGCGICGDMNQGESMIHCHCEPLERLLPELPPLLQAHWDESEAALFGPQVYALDTKRYACWERLGMLHVVTARDSSGSLQGYAAFTLTDCPHRPGKRLAALDGLYLAPARPQGPGRPEAAACGRGRAQGTRRGRGPVQFPGLPPL